KRSTSGWHPIHLASLLGDHKLIIEILNKGNIKSNQRTGNIRKQRGALNAIYQLKMDAITPLMCGAASGLIEVMKLLVGQGEQFSSNPIEDLEWAIRGKSPECFLYVAEKAPSFHKEGRINILELFITGALKDDAVNVLEIIVGFTKLSIKRPGFSTFRRSALANKIFLNCRALFFFALEKGFKEIIKLLIKKGKVNPNDDGSDDAAAEILDILLNNGTSVNKRDGKERTALNISATAGYAKCAFVLIQREAEISVSDLISLNERVPQFLKTYLDSFISLKGLTSSPSGELVSIDIRFMGVKKNGKMKENIKVQQDCKELQFLKFVIDDGQEELLMHPVIQTYLHIKWIICSKYFYCSVLIYIFQLLCFTLLVTEKYKGDDYSEITTNDTKPLARNNRTKIWFATFGTTTMIITRTLVLLNSLLLGTFKAQSLKHTFELVLIMSILMTILPFSEPPELSCPPFQRAIASISILLAWCYSLFHLAKHPQLGIYVEMLRKSIIYSKPVSDLAPLSIRKFLRRSIKLPLNVHIITIFPNKSDDKRLPQDLKQDALAVAKINTRRLRNERQHHMG
ncbi:Transient receptor potential channel pyrexia, partial [Orchesella cincta]